MKYLPEIITFILWPVFIYVSFRLSIWAVKRFEKIDGENKTIG